jgi:hypothetical protein
VDRTICAATFALLSTTAAAKKTFNICKSVVFVIHHFVDEYSFFGAKHMPFVSFWKPQNYATSLILGSMRPFSC